MSGEELARAFEDFVNGAQGKEVRAFVETLTTRTHRTLQQRAMGVIMECIKSWAQAAESERHDLRNEATCKLAQHIMKATPDYVGLPYI